MGHEIGASFKLTYVVFDNSVHAYEIATEVRFPISDQDLSTAANTMTFQDRPRVGIYYDEINLSKLNQFIQHPPEEGLAGKLSKVLARHALAMSLHG
jgi:hypothetical protein